MDLEIRRRKLLYQASYRGFKEADLVIGGFARAHIRAMSEVELDEFEALLSHNDHELYAWATGEIEPPAEIKGAVFDRLRSFELNP